MKATNKGRRRVENSPETQAVPTDWQVVSTQGSVPISETRRLDMLKQVDSLFDLGEIEAAVLKRHKISIGQAAGYFAQIIAAAELGGASWEARLKAACRKGEK